jgi:hypothetical protein
MSSNLSNKILNAEIPPPESAWDKIAAELEKSESPHFINKMAGASIEPPARVWDKVADALDESSPSKVFRIKRSWLKWTAAAAVIGLTIFSASYFFNGGKEPPAVSTKENGSGKEVNSAASTDAATKASPIPGNIARINAESKLTDNALLASNKRNLVGTTRKKEPPVRYAMVESPETENTLAKTTDGEPKVNNNISSDAASYIQAPDYFVVTAPNGERVKISSKFSEAVASLFGGDNVDYLWKSRFDSWKSKLMTNPSFIPAAGNFLDIVELKDLLKEQ